MNLSLTICIIFKIKYSILIHGFFLLILEFKYLFVQKFKKIIIIKWEIQTERTRIQSFSLNIFSLNFYSCYTIFIHKKILFIFMTSVRYFHFYTSYISSSFLFMWNIKMYIFIYFILQSKPEMHKIWYLW